MLTSLALLIFAAFLGKRLTESIGLPGLVGMMAAGAVLGPYGLDYLHQDLLTVSEDLRTLALILILLRAGLGLDRTTLNAVGTAAVKMGSLPCIFEGLAVMLLSRLLWPLTWLEAGMLGFVIAAVSPAVVVPAMIRLREKGLGGDKKIPTLILAGASLDDVFAITLFSAMMSMYVNASGVLQQLALLPVYTILGAVGGFALGGILIAVYQWKFFDRRNTEKLVLLLTLAILYYDFGHARGWASLLGVMAAGLILLEYRPRTAHQFSAKLGKSWVFAEIFLFGLVGAAVNTRLALEAGLLGLVIIAGGLLVRSAAVWISTAGHGLTRQERCFCAVAYWPKATVQAAMGGIPLALGVEQGDLILAGAVLAILFSAPLGAWAIQFTAPRWLQRG